MVRVLVDRREDALDRRLAAERTAALVHVRLELGAEFTHVARHGIDGEVPERAERLAEHAVAHAFEEVEVGVLGAALLDLRQQLYHPARPLAARRAFSARLVHVELLRA